MRREIDTHRFAHGCEESLLTQTRQELEASQLVLHRILHLGEAQFNACGAERVIELAERVACGDVDAGDRLCGDHDPAHRRG